MRRLFVCTLGILVLTGCGKGASKTPSLDRDLLTDTRGGDTGKGEVATDDGTPEVDFFVDFVGSGELPAADYSGQCEGPGPYPFGCPCNGNGECDSGFCVESPFGFVCTSECLEECPEGWSCRGITGFGADLVFVCIPETRMLCYPCQQDSQCGSGRCVDMDDGRYCTVLCNPNDPAPCGPSFSCKMLGEGEEDPHLCFPDSGLCGCTAKTAGQMQPCDVSNSFGTCPGYARCDPTAGWVECTARTPGEEVCDGIDNDCNGLIDESLPEFLDCHNESEEGLRCPGKAFCYGTQGWVCTAPEPGPEVCDYKDNNCDGRIDEDFTDAQGKYVHFDHCGACNASCSFGFPNAIAGCDAQRNPPQCVVHQCQPGYFKLNDFQCVPQFSLLCEACSTDDNCLVDGARCIDMSDGKFCTKPCETEDDCPSGFLCQEREGNLLCIPATNSCTCDGENTALSRSCSATWPPQPEPGTSVITCYGLQLCTESGWSDCQLPVEVCDGQDNDCNGNIDDSFLVDGRYVTDENCGQCGNNCTFMVVPNGQGVCNDSLAVPSCVVSCNEGFFDVNGNSADGCECHWLSETDVPDGIDRNCDGVDGDVNGAIFVAKNGNDANAGTRTEPMLTLQAAIDRADGGNVRDVYVASGVYAESVLLPAGVRVFGGYSSTFLERDIQLNVTVIMGQAASPERPGAVNALDIEGYEGNTILDGFTIYGRSSTSPGGSSYAVYVRNATNALRLSHNTIEAGMGAAGTKGLDGVNGASGKPGTAGSNAYRVGSRSCPNLPRIGAAGGSHSCDGTVLDGGKGGNNLCPSNFDTGPAAAENGVAGQGPAGGLGGQGGWTRQIWVFCAECRQASGSPTGRDGNPGVSGAPGDTSEGNSCQSTVAHGTVGDGVWLASGGLTGLAGGSGSGGGGGGAGGGAYGATGIGGCDDAHIGATGGGGGSGACGGTGGTGGGGGGGSFGLFLVWDQEPNGLPLVFGNTIWGGIGGIGGTGGNGGSGGVGGSGGTGGLETAGSAMCAGAGGTGGIGGHGGHGEGGGGGCGGASFCVFAYGQGTQILEHYKLDNTFFPGQGGLGGSGGPSIGSPGDPGAGGAAGEANF